jgi:hypothetical protein
MRGPISNLGAAFCFARVFVFIFLLAGGRGRIKRATAGCSRGFQVLLNATILHGALACNDDGAQQNDSRSFSKHGKTLAPASQPVKREKRIGNGLGAAHRFGILFESGLFNRN